MTDLGDAIDQIADKLGVAAGQIVPYFDQYAQMQADVFSILVKILVAVIAVCLVVVVMGIVGYLRNSDPYGDDDWSLVIGIPSIIGGVVAFVLLFAWFEQYKWANYPDAMLLGMIVDALNG